MDARGGRQLRLARALRAGQVFVNTYVAGGGVELRFGGMEGSGLGREKDFEARYGFSALETIAIQHGSPGIQVPRHSNSDKTRISCCVDSALFR